MVTEWFGPYRLDELIGSGGMGEVYRAFDTVKQRTVALKRLPVALAADAQFRARFRKESALAARLSEPHIIPIHDFGEIDGRLFIDMRLVAGRDLAGLLAERGPMRPALAVEIVGQVARALDAAHAEGLIHRDVKPSNVLLTGEDGDEFAYLIDFGISRALVGSAGTSITATGAPVGTLDYMAPERFLPDPIDARVDVYSLACLLFETLTGAKPFQGEGLPAMLHAHLNLDPPQPSTHQPGLPVTLDGVIARGMAKDPERRYPTAGALAAAARAVLVESVAQPAASPVSTVVGSRSAADHTTWPGTPPAMTQPTQKAAAETDLPASRWAPGRHRPARLIVIGLIAATAIGIGVILIVARHATPTVTATIPVGKHPYGVAVSPDGRRAYVGNIESGTVSVIDTGGGAVTATIPVGGSPKGVAVSPDGRRIYVNNISYVSVIDTGSDTVTATILVGLYGGGGVAVSPDGRRAYVAHASSVSVIDTGSGTVTATIDVGGSPWGVAVSPDGRRAYVTNYGSYTSSYVSAIDTSSGTVTATIPVGQNPHGVTVSPDGRRAYVANSGLDTVSVIDTGNGKATVTIPVGSWPWDIAVSPDGRRAYVTNSGPNNSGPDTVSVINTRSGTVTATIPVGSTAAGVAVSPDGRHAYITNTDSDTVSVIDIG